MFVSHLKCEVKWNGWGLKYFIYRNMYLSGKAAKDRGIFITYVWSKKFLRKTRGAVFSASYKKGVSHKYGAN